jgi:hypothetical protein
MINNLIAWGVPAIFATVAISTGEIDYVTSHYCGPTLAKGEALVWIPLLIYISVASILQIWTLVEIEEVRHSFIYGIGLSIGGEESIEFGDYAGS